MKQILRSVRRQHTRTDEDEELTTFILPPWVEKVRAMKVECVQVRGEKPTAA